MGILRKRASVLVGDICAVTIVLSGACVVALTMLSWVFDDVRIHGVITLAAIVFVAAAILYHVVEGG